MISETKFYGGSAYLSISGTTALSDNSGRFQRIHNVSAGPQNLDLPINLDVYHKRVDGGLWFVIHLDSTSTQNLVVRQIKAGTPSTLVTLTPGQVCHVWQTTSAEDWVAGSVRTTNTARTLSHSTSAGIVNDAKDPSYDPFCFEGSDCELAGAEPLNGQDGRDTVLAAMYQDVPLYAKNSSREAIRAADVVMPNKIVVRLDQGCFTVDPLHPLTKALSDEFYSKLFNDGNPHILDYYAAGASHSLTRHPYHIHWGGVTPTYGFSFDVAQQAYKYVWRKVIPYTVEATGISYQIEVRFVMEQAMSTAPVFDRCGGGGVGDSDSACWGALFTLQVFATEIHPTWVEGSNFQPAGSADAALSFTYGDPFVNGAWHGVDSISKKFCHPQMAMCAVLPTTWHSPVGRDWVPLHDRTYYHGFNDDPFGTGSERAHNREKAYNLDNGSPWTTLWPNNGSGTIYGNTGFGNSVGGYLAKGMSLGGNLPRSKPMEWLCWENGRGSGETFFKPGKPGWDEDLGVLDLTDGNCGSLTLPIDCYGTRDLDTPSSENKWHLDPHECIGHPDEPFEGYGGTHTCFRNYDGGTANGGVGDSTICCVSLTFQASETTQICTRSYDVLDESCSLVSSYCSVTGWAWARRIVYLSDYSYYAAGNQLLRFADWKRILPDPTQTNYSYTYDSTNVSDLVNEEGTWTLAGVTPEISNSAVSGADPVRAALLYKPSGWTNNRDCVVSAQARKIKQKSHGLIVKSTTSAGTVYGYGLNVVPVTPGAGTTDLTVELCKYNATGKHVLATATIAGVSTEVCDLQLEAWGTDLIGAVTPQGGATLDITAWDKEFSTGYPGVYTEATATGNIQFDLFAIEDTSVDFLEIQASFYANSVTCTWPEELTHGYNWCNLSSNNPECGTTPFCSCIQWVDQKYQQLTASKPSNGRDYTEKAYDGTTCTAGDNPTWCHGPDPSCCEYSLCVSERLYSCDQCPPPFAGISFCIVNACNVSQGYMDPSCDAFQEKVPYMCMGMTGWVWSNLACF